jgi:hypothetical protein
MQTLCKRRQGFVMPEAQQVSNDLAERIRKLRWLGMQQEAEELHMMLRRVPHTDCVIVMPRETD